MESDIVCASFFMNRKSLFSFFFVVPEIIQFEKGIGGEIQDHVNKGGDLLLNLCSKGVVEAVPDGPCHKKN